MMSHTSLYLRGSIGCLLAAAALAGCAKEPAKKVDESKSAVADLALTGGAIYTVDGSRSWAQAIAIDDGRIVYVGTDAGAKDYIGPQTKVVPLKGRMVVPGFPGRAHPPDLGRHRGERLRPERGHDGRGDTSRRSRSAPTRTRTIPGSRAAAGRCRPSARARSRARS